MSHEVERYWTTRVGYEAVIIIVKRQDGSKSHRCGYVGIPPEHPLFGIDYAQQAPSITQAVVDAVPLGKKSPILAFTAMVDSDDGESVRRSPDILFDVHGGLTYAGGHQAKYPVETDARWWYGFDANHSGDGYIDQPDWGLNLGEPKSHDYMAYECESLAKQLADFTQTQEKAA